MQPAAIDKENEHKRRRLSLAARKKTGGARSKLSTRGGPSSETPERAEPSDAPTAGDELEQPSPDSVVSDAQHEADAFDLKRMEAACMTRMDSKLHDRGCCHPQSQP